MEPKKPKTSVQPGPPSASAGNFVRELIAKDKSANLHGGRVATRFPPEPNGYLHIGHAKAICIDFGLAHELGGTCNLRFDDTNPTTEDVEYVEAIQEDIRWLGFEWSGLYYASDYFEQLYDLAIKLIKKGKAYVDSLNEEEIREYRGDFYKKGRPSPHRGRTVEENLDLFARMRAGEFSEGQHVLRAIIDLETQNMNMRDPVLYRVRYAPHHRTGTKWCIYPMYDFAHPLSDAIEKITHSICTVEFEAHRPLYDWCIREAEVFPSRQIEFARLNLTYTVMSKRKLAELVQKGVVSGWDDPRMPTLAGLRRRGYTPEAIRVFCERIGVSKTDSLVDVGLLEHGLREDLNRRCPRVMAVLRPLKVVLENFPEGETREADGPLNPEDATQGSRKVPLAREIYIERDDFREDPPKDWFRLAPGREVRLRYACLIRCTEVIKDVQGEVVELRCVWDPESWGGSAPDGRIVRGTLHWVAASHAVPIEARLYDRLFSVQNPGATEGRSFLDEVNPESMLQLTSCLAEPYLAKAGVTPGARFQFERLGYFCLDPASAPERQIWNRTVTLKDSWAKIESKGAGSLTAKPGARPNAEAGAKDGGVTESISSGADKVAQGGTHASPKQAVVSRPPGAAGFGAGAHGGVIAASGAVTVPAAVEVAAGDKKLEKKVPGVVEVPAGDKKLQKTAASSPPGASGPAAEIGIEDLARVDLRVGIVREAAHVPEAQKLIRLMVDLGEGRLRQIFAGLKAFYPDPTVLVGRRVIVVANLKPRAMKFGVSEGMILAAGGGDRPHLIATFDDTGDPKVAPQPGDKIG